MKKSKKKWKTSEIKSHQLVKKSLKRGKKWKKVTKIEKKWQTSEKKSHKLVAE